MKTKSYLLLVFSLLILLTGCPPYGYYMDYSAYKPIVMERTTMESAIAYSSSRKLVEPGKIYFKDNFILINEKYEGIHVIDNTNPSSPVNVGFIVIPGSIDIAMKFDVLYADNSVDLIAIDLSAGIDQLKVTKRVRDVFPELSSPDGLSIDPLYDKDNRPEGTLIVGWTKR